jgi:predicted nucleic acid-binding protein
LNLEVTGTVGVRLLARQTGLIDSVRVWLERMREHGYWLSDELIAQAGRIAGED